MKITYYKTFILVSTKVAVTKTHLLEIVPFYFAKFYKYKIVTLYNRKVRRGDRSRSKSVIRNMINYMIDLSSPLRGIEFKFYFEN